MNSQDHVITMGDRITKVSSEHIRVERVETKCKRQKKVSFLMCMDISLDRDGRMLVFVLS